MPGYMAEVLGCCSAVVKVSNLGAMNCKFESESGQRLIIEQVTLSALFTRPLEDEKFDFRDYMYIPLQLLTFLSDFEYLTMYYGKSEHFVV